MAACPNCGRQTLRTKDWACQWCGYPLISRAFKKIDKTYKELQEERSQDAVSAESGAEVESEFEPEYEAEPEPEPEPEPRPRPQPRPVPRPKPRPEPEPEPEPRPQARPVRRPEPAPEPIRRPSPPVKPVYKPEPEYPSEPEPRTAAASLPAPRQLPPSTPKPEIIVERQPPPVPSIKLEAIQDGMEITAGQLDELFRADKSGINAKLTGKTLVLKGVVEKVFVREHLEIRYILITGSKKTVWSARCTFGQESSSQVSRLTEGQEVVARGKYDGYGKNIIFKECVLV